MGGRGDKPGEQASPLTEPFFWTAGEIGCLLVHGFTGTPYEMRFLGEHLHAAGYSVGGVRLPGHATRVEELERCRWTDWYQSVEDGFDQLSQHCSRVVGIGLSMGALLSVGLAVRHASRVAALVLLSPSFELANPWAARLAPIARFALPILPDSFRYLAKGESDIADPRERRQRPTYRRIPVRGVAELVELQRHARAWLPSVRQPVLVVHARQDHTAPLSNVDLVRAAVGESSRAVILEDSYHVITVDREKERVASEVSRFIAANAAVNAGGSRGE